MSLSTIINYVNPANFTFDSSVVEFDGSRAKLKSLLALPVTFAASFGTDFNAHYGLGTLTGTAFGSPTVSGGKLNLTGNVANKYVDWSGTGNSNHPTTGAWRFKYTPNYSGNPANLQQIITVSAAAGNIMNQMQLQHASSDGQLLLATHGSNSIFQTGGTGAFGIWVPVTGQTYEIEVNYDFTGAGACRIFIDGVQKGSTLVGTATRNNTMALLRVGGSATYTGAVNFSIDDLHIFNSVQHTANYTPGAEVSNYSTTNPSIKVVSAIATDDVLTFEAVTSATGLDAVKFQLEVDGILKYWNGTAWVTAFGYAQSNTIAEINTNSPALLSAGAEVKLVAYLHSDSGITYPSITSATFSYDFFVPQSAPPSECQVYLWAKDLFGDDVGTANNAKLNVVNDTPFFIGNFLIPTFTKTIPLDVNGYADVSLVQTGTSKVSFYLTYKDGSKKKRINFTPVAVPAFTSAPLGSFATVKDIEEVE